MERDAAGTPTYRAGRVVEQGSHAELLAMNGLYARYWNRQSGGFIGIDDKEAAE